MQIFVFFASRSTRVVATLLQLVSRVTLVVLAVQQIPLLWPALYDALDYQPVTPMRLARLLAILFLLPEAGAWIVRRSSAATLRIEDGMLVAASRAERHEIPIAQIATISPWALPFPMPGLRLSSPSGELLLPPIATADPSILLSALADAGASGPARRALAHPSVRHARAREGIRGRLDHPLIQFVLFSLVPALPLFRLRQWITYGGTFGEYHSFGLKAYLLGFGLYWLLSAMYLLLFAAVLRVLGDALTLLGLWALPGREFGVRRAAEWVHRAVYYLTPPVLLIVRLVLQ